MVELVVTCCCNILQTSAPHRHVHSALHCKLHSRTEYPLFTRVSSIDLGCSIRVAGELLERAQEAGNPWHISPPVAPCRRETVTNHVQIDHVLPSFT